MIFPGMNIVQGEHDVLDVLMRQRRGPFEFPQGGLFPQEQPMGVFGRVNQALEPLGGATNLGAQLLANSYGSGSFGEALGRSVLGAQQSRAAEQDRRLREEYLQAQIEQMRRGPQRKPVVVAGKDGKPVYVDEQEAIGQAPYLEGSTAQPTGLYAEYLQEHPDRKVPYFDWLKNRTAATTQQPRGSYSAIPTGDGTYGILDSATGQITPSSTVMPPKQTALPAELQRATVAMNALDQALTAYEKELKDFNPRSTDQANMAKRARINSLMADIKMQYKEAQALGALTGPDVAVLEQALTNPGSAMAALYGGAGLREQISQTREAIKRRQQALRETPTQNPGRQPPAPSDTDPLGILK